MGARDGVDLKAVIVLCCVSNLTFFLGLWPRVSECGVSHLELCLARLLVSGLCRRRVVY